jgi:hypothetical protein
MQLCLIQFPFRAFSARRRFRTDSQAGGLGFYISRRWRLEHALKAFALRQATSFQIGALERRPLSHQVMTCRRVTLTNVRRVAIDAGKRAIFIEGSEFFV